MEYAIDDSIAEDPKKGTYKDRGALLEKPDQPLPLKVQKAVEDCQQDMGDCDGATLMQAQKMLRKAAGCKEEERGEESSDLSSDLATRKRPAMKRPAAARGKGASRGRGRGRARGRGDSGPKKPPVVPKVAPGSKRKQKDKEVEEDSAPASSNKKPKDTKGDTKDDPASDKETTDLGKLVDISSSCKFMMVPEKALAGNAKSWSLPPPSEGKSGIQVLLSCRAFYINDVTDAKDRIAKFNKQYDTNFKENWKTPPGLNIGWIKFADLESAWYAAKRLANWEQRSLKSEMVDVD